MLNKIINIRPGTDYNKSANSGKNGSFGKHLGMDKFLSKDSIHFSPAVIFLSQIKWGLKDLKYEPNEKLIIKFTTGGYEFSASINLASLRDMHIIMYDVQTLIDETNLSLTFSVPFNFYSTEDFYEPRLSHLNRLFIRTYDAVSFKDDFEIDELDHEDLIDGLKIGLLKEFDQINSYLLIFIEKYTNINYTSIKLKPVSVPNFFIIERIEKK